MHCVRVRSDWQDDNNDLEIAYVKMNDTTKREVSLIGMYSEHSSIYPPPIRSLFDDTFWDKLPVMTHETFRVLYGESGDVCYNAGNTRFGR